ncbi:hypothetical protein [Noviherbaspirillum malthae]|uniref:hypothetical protein n=1 Tax=Noviherbaspirillum malthae TaxID=1260987 RepID=UPI00188F36C1|nr:hypothetical protein [Noviherbaspirillum malthae]
MPEKATLTQEELEIEASKVVGQIVFALSRMEFNLGLCLRNLVGGQDVEAVNPLIARLSFKAKLDALLDVVKHKFSTEAECIGELKAWHAKMDEVRISRNSFVHGRWGTLAAAQEVVNVSPGLPNAAPQKETRYSLDDLAEELEEIKQVVDRFYNWRSRWRV